MVLALAGFILLIVCTNLANVLLARGDGPLARARHARGARGRTNADRAATAVGEGLLLVLTGVAAGALASLLLMRVLESQLYGVILTDPATFVVAPAVLLPVALLACYVPARRATRVEAVTALRAE